MNETLRRWLALAGLLAAAALAIAASAAAVGVRRCPQVGSCEWSPPFALPAAVITVLAVVACVEVAQWGRCGRRGVDAWSMLAVALTLGVLWSIGFLLAPGH